MDEQQGDECNLKKLVEFSCLIFVSFFGFFPLFFPTFLKIIPKNISMLHNAWLAVHFAMCKYCILNSHVVVANLNHKF